MRNYNEDRVSIIVNVNNQNFLKAPTSCSYFAVYDGHGGHTCSDYLRDNLHLHVNNIIFTVQDNKGSYVFK